jgi:hypothetical protein
MDLSKITEDELATLHADVQAERRRRASKPDMPVGYQGSDTGWSVQSGRLIKNDDRA